MIREGFNRDSTIAFEADWDDDRAGTAEDRLARRNAQEQAAANRRAQKQDNYNRMRGVATNQGAPTSSSAPASSSGEDLPQNAKQRKKGKGKGYPPAPLFTYDTQGAAASSSSEQQEYPPLHDPKGRGKGKSSSWQSASSNQWKGGHSWKGQAQWTPPSTSWGNWYSSDTYAQPGSAYAWGKGTPSQCCVAPRPTVSAAWRPPQTSGTYVSGYYGPEESNVGESLGGFDDIYEEDEGLDIQYDDYWVEGELEGDAAGGWEPTLQAASPSANLYSAHSSYVRENTTSRWSPYSSDPKGRGKGGRK